MASPHLFLLGPPKFELKQKPIQIGSAKAVALLGYLAATGEPQSRERLLGLLWSESSEDAARKNLRNTLWSIRKALGDDVLIAGDDHLSIDKSAWVDVREFEKLSTPSANQDPESALRLYRGNLLEGIEIADAPEFEIWLTGVRERLAQLYSRALSTGVESLRARGDWQGVIEMAHRALAHDNLQEPMYRALMEGHARLGERAEALRNYDALQSTLERELGVDPLPESKSLRTAILDGSIQPAAATASLPATRPPSSGAQAASEAAAASKPLPSSTTRSPFIGRRAELLLLDRELELARGGHARIALLTGEVGIGKSRLWREWSGTLGPQATVLEARSLDSMQTLPFAPLAEMFRQPALARRLFQPSSPVSPIWLAEVARLLPELRASLPQLPAPAALPPDEERRRLFEAFTQCLLALGQPLVLFFDDIHWADRAMLDWLDYLVHRLRDRSLLLVAAYRPEDAAGPLVHLLAGWGREGLVQKIPLARLTPAESAALVAALGGSPEVAEKVEAQSAGNPYFLIELYRASPTDIPPVLSDLVRARLDRLPGTAQQVLQAASVLQPDFDFATLRRTSGRSEEETLEALDGLLNASLVAERDGHYVFTHPLIPAVVAGGLSGARRAFIHRRAAQALEVTNAGRLAQVAGALAGHYEQAGDTSRAAHFAEMAADHALELAASAEAIAFYRQALLLEPTPARQMGLGRVLLRQAELEEARAAFESALQGFEASGDRRSAARAALSIAETFYPSGKFEEGGEWIVKGMGLTEGENDLESDALAHLALGSAQILDPKTIVEGEKNLREAVRHAEEGQLPDLAARASFSLGNLLAERGDLDRALKAYSETVRFAQLAGDDFQEALGHNNLAYHAVLLGDLATAHAELEAGLTLAEAHALRLPLQHLYSTRGEIALAEQKWDQAEEWFGRALVESEKNGNSREIANDRANLGLAARGRGDLDGAVMLLESARDLAARLTDMHLQIKVHLWLAELYLQRGERAAARESLDQARKRLKGIERKRLLEWADELEGRLIAAG